MGISPVHRLVKRLKIYIHHLSSTTATHKHTHDGLYTYMRSVYMMSEIKKCAFFIFLLVVVIIVVLFVVLFCVCVVCVLKCMYVLCLVPNVFTTFPIDRRVCVEVFGLICSTFVLATNVIFRGVSFPSMETDNVTDTNKPL